MVLFFYGDKINTMNKNFFLFISISFLFIFSNVLNESYSVDNEGYSVNYPEAEYELDNADIERLNRNFIEIEYALKDKDYEKAIRLLQESEMIDPSNENITLTLTVTLSNYSVYLSSQNDFENAIDNIEQAYVISPSDEVKKIYKTILNNYVVTLLNKQDWEAALANLHYLRSLETYQDDLNDKIAQVYCRWGINLLDTNENDQAQDKFLRVLQYDNSHSDALFYLGYILYNLQDLRTAKYYWSILAKKDPDYMQVDKLLSKLERELSVEEKFQYKNEDRFHLHYGENLDEDVINEINDALNSAYDKICARLSYYPSKKIPVIIMDRTDFSMDTNLPYWIAGLYDGKIRLPIPADNSGRIVSEELRQTIFHEFTHVLIHGLSADKVPLWFNEGLAEYSSGKKTDYTLLKENLLNNSYISFANLNRSLYDKTNPQRMRLAYESSMSVVDYIFYRYGIRKIKKMIFLFSEDKTQKEVFKLCFGLSEYEFEQRWKKYLYNNLLSFTERKKVRSFNKRTADF